MRAAKSTATTVRRHIVLVGGGHTHALVLAALARQPLKDAAVTLMSDVRATAYSGMIAGFIAGQYTRAACHIDLEALSRRAGATFSLTACTGVDTVAKTVLTATGVVPYDVLSLNVGSGPDPSLVASLPRAVGVRPTASFLDEIERVLAAGKAGTPRVLIVGGGVAGCEVALCLQRRLGARGVVALREQGPTLAPALGQHARSLLARALAAAGVDVGVSTDVTADIAAAYDAVIVATPGRPPTWLAASGLPTLADGSVRVDATLRTVGQSHVFAAGDCASMEGMPRPKAGVYAVRQAQPLLDNLRRLLAGQDLRPYRPQRQALILVNDGSGQALFIRGGWVAGGRWAWHLKDFIDRRFVDRFA